MAQITLNSTGVASSGTLALQSNGTTTAVTIDASQNVGVGIAADERLTVSISNPTDGRVASLRNSGTSSLTGTKLWFNQNTVDNWNIGQPAGVNAFVFCNSTGSTNERMRIDSSGNVGIGTSSPASKLTVSGDIQVLSTNYLNFTNTAQQTYLRAPAGNTLAFGTNSTEAMRIDSSGNLLVGKTAVNITDAGQVALSTGRIWLTTSANDSLTLNRLTNDGVLAEFRQDSTLEGSISVSGTTVSYNGGHLSRWAQTTTAKDESLVKGTVLSNLDEMNVYTDAEGNTVDNEQLNKVKVSDVEGDVNVAGVFVNWTHDDAHDVDEINMAMTGDMIIRIAQGVTVARGDLLMSAGDGTAKPQGDDIVRSKTVAKVTSTHVTCTYADGSYCVPCVLMAC